MSLHRSDTDEPIEVRVARETIRRWELRNGHASYVECLDGGHQGYQARCGDCDWTGTEHLRGDEPLGTTKSRSHKILARIEAGEHQRATAPANWRLA